ncbi:uncharacterized protein LOC144137932 isoform X3 [Haemaphysalis longicornis]
MGSVRRPYGRAKQVGYAHFANSRRTSGGGGPPDPPVRRRRTAEVTPAGVVAVINCGVPPRPPPQLLHQQPRPPLGGPSYSDPFHFREMELLTEMGVAYARQVRNVRRITVADTGALRQFSSQGRKTVEEVEEGLFQIQRMHSHMVARANNLVYRLQDVLLQEESNRLRKQMHRIATLPPEKQTAQVRDREHDLIVRIVRIVNKRDAILAEHHVEQRRAANELRQMEKEYQKWRRALGDEESEFSGEWTETFDVGAPFPEWATVRQAPSATPNSAKKPASKTFAPFRSLKKRVARTVGKVASKKKGAKRPTAQTNAETCSAKL